MPAYALKTDLPETDWLDLSDSHGIYAKVNDDGSIHGRVVLLNGSVEIEPFEVSSMGPTNDGTLLRAINLAFSNHLDREQENKE